VIHILLYSTLPPSTLNIHTPGVPTLLVLAMLIMLGVSDPGIVIELMPSPILIPARTPFLVHCISPSA